MSLVKYVRKNIEHEIVVRIYDFEALSDLRSPSISVLNAAGLKIFIRFHARLLQAAHCYHTYHLLGAVYLL